ncbi:family 16 glycoside hydrolase [Melampsora americana]|nr:family 16 glycoside hydrolase [Melampsora americana]
MNVVSLAILVGGLIALFALYPIITYVVRQAPGLIGWNLGGINGTGQVPDIPGLPQLIDATTPDNAKTRTGFDGQKYNLVFSDEFNTDGRTFWPGDDPFWEAVDLHYWQTTNFEWYDPDAVTTKDGNLVIQLSQEPIHNLNVRSGMIQSWNKFCFTEGYIEVNISLPGKPGVQGLWPGVWTMGNLARAGFGATNEGMWPYSYEACDVGTLPNQTNPDGRTPEAAKTSGSHDYGGELSWLPGQRTSACTCKGEDHPGPHEGVGRSGPEIDVLEAQYGYGANGNIGSVSQSIQIAPMDAGYQWANDSSSMHIVNQVPSTSSNTGTVINTWHGAIWQESLSGITMSDGTSYDGKGYQTFGFEYVKGYQADGGRVTWAYNGQETWSIYASAIGQPSATEISPRPISMEPMYVILNLGISNKFQIVEWDKLTFPANMYIDYVRIYQKDGHTNIGCNPKDHPTEDYINRHMAAYTNPNFTTWQEAGYTFPKNKLKDSC